MAQKGRKRLHQKERMNGYVVCRQNCKTLRREWLNACEYLSDRRVVWLVSESEIAKFLSRKDAQSARQLALSAVNNYRWKVVGRPFGKVDVIKKPVLTGLDWKQTNTYLGRLYNVSSSTIANWRVAAGARPAPRGGARSGAGRKRKH